MLELNGLETRSTSWRFFSQARGEPADTKSCDTSSLRLFSGGSASMKRFTILALGLLLALQLALPALCSAYEPIADPQVRLWQARATPVQLVKLESLAALRKVDLTNLMLSCYHVERKEQLSMAQAAELIIALQQRGQYDISRPHTLRNWIGALQDRNLNRLGFPLVVLFGL
jgi:hypothetical protein